MPTNPRHIRTGPFSVRRRSDGVLIVNPDHELSRDRLALSPADADLLIAALTELREETP